MVRATMSTFVRPQGGAKVGGAGDQTQQPPRHRMRGGSRLHGSTPLAAGHAGRKRLFGLTVFTLLFLMLFSPRAYASQTLNFQNGGTAVRNDDGTITGTLYVKAVWQGLATSYFFTMPDGQTIPAHCIDFGLVDPADDNYSFTATPVGDGSYSVHAHTNLATYYQTPAYPRIEAAGSAVQRTVSDGTWAPQVVVTGMAYVIKTSSNLEVTQGLGTYSLQGATFSVWYDQACTSRVDNITLTTDADGNTTAATLNEGTYWIREDQAPTGFEIDPTPKSFSVTAGNTATIPYTDAPTLKEVDLLAKKVDKDTISAQGSSVLKGAEFTVRYYDGYYSLQNLPSNPTRTWVFSSDSQGSVRLDASTKVQGPDLYFAGTTPVLPLGTLTIQETKAPKGYFLEGQTPSSGSGHTAPVHLVSITRDADFEAPTVSDSAVRAGLSLQKNDEETGSTPQGDASLANIGFQIYNANDTSVVVDGVSYIPGAPIGSPLMTNNKGQAQTAANYLPLGTYEVREVSTNESMQNSSKPQTVTLKESNANERVSVGTFKDPVVRGGVRVSKLDADLLSAQAQGDATLENTQFRITLDSTNPVVVKGKTYSKGQTVMTITTNKDGVAQTGATDLPYGTYTIRESKPPLGYRTCDVAEQFSIREHGVVLDLGTFVCADPIIRGGVRLGKIDSDFKAQRAQGDATLEGAEFSIISQNNNPVVVGGTTYAFGDVVATLQTDAQGVASTAADTLPYGTYTIRETNAPEGYLIDESFEKTFSIRTAGAIENLGTSACVEPIKRGGLAVGKVSRETSQHVGQGEATLAGAVLQVKLVSEQPVIVNGNMYDPQSVVCTLTTGENGYAATDAHLLPYGTYEIREVEPPAGFLPNDDWSITVEIRDDGVVVDKSDEANSVDDQVMRGGFSLNKVDENTMERMGNTGFSITSTTTGERHIAVTDENGYFNTETFSHTQNTNANDSALSEDNSLDSDKVVPDAGIWFSGLAQGTTEPNNDFGALPYDVYAVEELRSKSNEGRQLVAFTVRIHQNEYFVDMGTVDNKTDDERQYISTTLTYNGTDHVAPVSERLTLTDTVRYEGLTPNTQYTLEGKLVVKGDYDGEQGIIATANTLLTPTTSQGTATLDFTFDSRELAGKTTVALEYLSLDGTVVASHEDLDDEGQTVRIPSISTSCTDSEGGQEVSTAQDRIALIDTVTYENLEPNRLYVLEGTLYNKDDGAKIVDEQGREMTSVVSFFAEDANGSVEVPFSVTTSMVEGKTLVAFEYLRRGDCVIASHEDPEDGGQTVTLPRIRTELQDNTGSHTATANETITLTDTVTYTNLTPGKEYELHGTLVDKQTGEPLFRADGSPIESRTSFIPEGANGVATLSFEVSGALLVGKQVVAFETLSKEGRDVAIHADIEDPSQTVSTPSISTQLSNGMGSHEVEALEQVDLIDTVAYSGLTPGETYKMVGTLLDAKTGDTLRNDDGSDVTNAVEFSPTATSGSVEIPFTISSSNIAGTSVVAFERLQIGEGDNTRIIATHEDLNDVGQTVTFPQIGTHAHDAEDGDKYAIPNSTMHIIDVVAYQNLRPGSEYVIVGTLYDKDTGNAITDDEGKAITSSITFTPTESAGEATLEFTFDSSLTSCSAIVVFESCQQNGVEVAVHADINDENQTVHTPRIATQATSEESNSHEATPSKEVSIVDAVTYSGLIPNKEYKIVGTLMNKATSQPVKSEQGSNVTSEAAFTPRESDGVVSLKFTFDASSLEGGTIVAYERLYAEGELIALHEDLESADQSIRFSTPKETTPEKEKASSGTTTKQAGATTTNTAQGSATKTKTPSTLDATMSPLLLALVGSAALVIAINRR